MKADEDTNFIYWIVEPRVKIMVRVMDKVSVHDRVMVMVMVKIMVKDKFMVKVMERVMEWQTFDSLYWSVASPIMPTGL